MGRARLARARRGVASVGDTRWRTRRAVGASSNWLLKSARRGRRRGSGRRDGRAARRGREANGGRDGSGGSACLRGTPATASPTAAPEREDWRQRLARQEQVADEEARARRSSTPTDARVRRPSTPAAAGRDSGAESHQLPIERRSTLRRPSEASSRVATSARGRRWPAHDRGGTCGVAGAAIWPRSAAEGGRPSRAPSPSTPRDLGAQLISSSCGRLGR